MVNNHCPDCYWVYIEYDDGGNTKAYRCRRYPPQPARRTWLQPKPTPYDPLPRTVQIEACDQLDRWPLVEGYEWCGEFKRREGSAG